MISPNEVTPVIKEHDREQKHIPWVFKRLGELGILGICLPVKLGGAGMDYVSLGLACEELECIDISLRVIPSVHVGLNSLALFQWGTEKQKNKYLTPQAKGEKIATYGLTEPEPVPMQPASVPRPDGGATCISSMAKTCLPNGPPFQVSLPPTVRLSRR